MLTLRKMLPLKALSLRHTTCAAWAARPPAPANLRVERLLERDALGVDAPAPLFSWAFEPGSERDWGFRGSLEPLEPPRASSYAPAYRLYVF